MDKLYGLGEQKFFVFSGGDMRGRYTARQGDGIFITSIHNKLDVY
jgi:hypothetical protein